MRPRVIARMGATIMVIIQDHQRLEDVVLGLESARRQHFPPQFVRQFFGAQFRYAEFPERAYRAQYPNSAYFSRRHPFATTYPVYMYIPTYYLVELSKNL